MHTLKNYLTVAAIYGAAIVAISLPTWIIK